MQLEIIWTHGIICTIFLFIFYFLTSSRKIWYAVAGIYFISMVLLVAYVVVFEMTGSGFNEAALYYVLNASWKDAFLLTSYKSFQWGGALLFVLLVFFSYFVYKISLPRLIKISISSQLILALAGAGFGLYMTPLAADISQVMRLSGMDKKDSIGLGKILHGVDIPQALSGEKKNLIVLYAESMEAAFFDEKIFPGLLPELNSLVAKGAHFDHIEQAPMSNWTIAGMIATQCGVPLSSHRLRNEPNNFEKFSKGHYCLANHLEAQQYKRIYMGGADTEFAGKGEFYETMKFHEILGSKQLESQDSPQSKWGLYDDELLPLVQRKLEFLRNENKSPFSLFLLTLDSHPPQGFASPACEKMNVRYGKGKNTHLNTIHCSDILLANFLKKIIDKNIHDSTIVMLSDHVMMNSDATVELEKNGAKRRNHMIIWDRDISPQTIGRISSQFDVGATILHVLLGQSWQVGFGTSMLDKNRKNLTELYGIERLDESVYAWRTESWKKW